jgi:hypothetical protein
MRAFFSEKAFENNFLTAIIFIRKTSFRGNKKRCPKTPDD